MHESHRSTALGLGRLVDKLQAMGYELVTVQELLPAAASRRRRERRITALPTRA
jgi:hypothetical protein